MSFNLVVVRGACSSPAVVRVLESGTALAQLQLTVRPDEGPATSVPVAVWEPAAWVEALEVGAEVVVIGRVKRRFYRSGSGTGSRVEVESDYIVPATDRRRLQAARRRADALIQALAD